MTTNLVLSGDQFDGLSAGYGTPDALGILRDGQLTKRKLLLATLIEKHGHGLAVDLLLRAEAAAPAVVGDVLRHPHLDGWATQALRTDEDLGYLGLVAASAALQAGLDFEIAVPVTDGQVYLPGLGAAAVPGEETVVRGDGTVGPVRIGGPGWTATHVVELEPAFEILVEDQEPFRDVYQWRPEPRLDDDAAARFAGLLRDAWSILVDRHPRHADAMRVLLRMIVPLAKPAGGGNVSAASRQASGSIAVMIPRTAEELSLLMLHEFMHMKLDALRDLVDLHHVQAKGLFLAPWRMDPRPVGPLFQGIYAHAGVTDYWRKRRLTADAPAVADVEFAYWRQQNRLAIEALAQSGELTQLGDRFVAGLRQTLESWQQEHVPDDVRRGVETMVLAQTIRWRLRNWDPSDSEVTMLARAWQRGERPEPVDLTGVLRGESQGEASSIPGIVGQIRGALAGRRPTDEADLAYIEGDDVRAMRLYADRLRNKDQDDAWVGFALATGGLAHQRPDLLQAVVRKLPPSTDSVAVATWMRALTCQGG
ncbi:HEXXH motif domain-containing protein [Actinoplanes sp. NPDC026619]|uniref:HEXXH motif domain-containing protein n=1 Tax=Actinoplanes sp. NPDC026619 TaxID=3155798 RepID=UPI00340D9896